MRGRGFAFSCGGKHSEAEKGGKGFTVSVMKKGKGSRRNSSIETEASMLFQKRISNPSQDQPGEGPPTATRERDR